MTADTKEEKYANNILNDLCDFLCNRLENIHVWYLTIYFAIISVLELVAYSKNSGVATALASRIWIIGGVFCFTTIIYYFVITIKSDISQKNIISLVGIIGVLIYLFYICGNVNYSDISQDATQQAAAGLNSYLSNDFNYTGKAFLGYPNRQYVLIAFPAYLFGRSIATLHLGFAIPFVLGIIALYSGLRQWSDKKEISGKYAIVSIFSLFAFRFVTEYYMNFEQALLPISLTMILIGLFLNILTKPNMICMVSIAWIGCLCSNSYTPVLASLGLLLVFVTLLAFVLVFLPSKLPFSIENRLQTAIILFAADVNILFFFLATLIGKRADRLTMLKNDIKIVPFSWKSICDFLTDKNAVFLGGMGIVVMIYIVASLTMQLKIHDLLLALWVLGVFIASNLMLGCTTYTAAWIMQRALIIIPVVITGMSLTFYDFVQNHQVNVKNLILVCVIIAFAFIGRYNFMQINQSFTYFNSIQPMKYMLKDLETTTKENEISHLDGFNFVFLTNNILIQNVVDYFQFFYPNATIYIGVNGQFPSGINVSQPTIIYSDTDITNLTPSMAIQLVEYKNKRYNTAGIWYKGIIK